MAVISSASSDAQEESARRISLPSNALLWLRILLISTFCIPTLAFAIASILTYRAMFATAEARIAQLSEVATEHASKVFETSELVLDRIADRVSKRSWDEIANSNDVHDFLLEMKASLPQASAIGVIGPDGRVISSDYAFPTPAIRVDDRDYMRVSRTGDSDPFNDIFISDTRPGMRTGTPLFAIARPIPGKPILTGRNFINIAIPPAYLAQHYAAIAGDDSIYFRLVRADGEVLMRSDTGPPGPERLTPPAPFLEKITENPERGSFQAYVPSDRTTRLYAYERVPNYGLYVVVGTDRGAVVAAWMVEMGEHLAYGVPVTLALIFVTFTAIRRTRQEQAATARAQLEGEKRERVEKDYQQMQKLEAVGQLTGGIAHDFNNVLTVITGNLDLLERHVASEAGRRMISAMNRAAGRAARLTQSLLAFSRKQPLRPETVNANRLINEFGELLRRAVGDAAEIQFLLSPTLDPCRIDPAQLQSAVLNLVVNARDAIDRPDGKITVQTENVLFDDRRAPPLPEIKPGPYILICVSDNGAGMAPEVLEHVFEPFFTTKEVGKGSGLGLAQVYGFVSQSGGHVRIASDVGAGTQVSMYLPRAPSRPPEEVARGQPAPLRTRTARILMVEDDPEVRDTVAAELTNLGYQIMTAEDGHAALGILERDIEIDLLFSDVIMPKGIRGDELARRARRMRPGLRVLLTSGYPAADLEERRSLREFTLLAKPYRIEDLARAIEDRLAR